MIALVAGFAPWVVCHGLAIAAVNMALLVLHVAVVPAVRALRRAAR
jgi:hypothetical protein